MTIRIAEPASSTGEVLRFWNSQLGRSFPLDERLWRQAIGLERGGSLLIAAFLPGARDGAEAGTGTEVESGGPAGGARPSLAALRDAYGPVAALALVKRASRPSADGSSPAHGNLSFIITAEGARRKGLGSALLARAESWLRAGGAKRLHLGRDSYHFFPGAPLDPSPGGAALMAFLRERGFEAGSEEHDLIADLGELELGELGRRVRRTPEYRTRAYDPALRAALERFFRGNFPGRWYADTIEALDAGMRPEDLLLLVEESSGTVVGFSRIYDAASPVLGPGVYWRALMGARPCALGPIGVDESRRGEGLGLRLLYDSMTALAERGGRTMVIDWTDLVGFYGKMGFRIWKSYRLMSKDLGASHGPE